jgi:hypothetical protein
MILSQNESIFLNIVTSLNSNHIRYWIDFSITDIHNNHCLLMNKTCKTYVIHISDDYENMEQFKLIVQIYYQTYEGYYFKNNVLYNSLGHMHIKITRYDPFYNPFHTNYVFTIWCLNAFEDDVQYPYILFMKNKEDYIKYVYLRDFKRHYIDIKGIHVKIMKAKLTS